MKEGCASEEVAWLAASGKGLALRGVCVRVTLTSTKGKRRERRHEKGARAQWCTNRRAGKGLRAIFEKGRTRPPERARLHVESVEGEDGTAAGNFVVGARGVALRCYTIPANTRRAKLRSKERASDTLDPKKCKATMGEHQEERRHDALKKKGFRGSASRVPGDAGEIEPLR